MDYGSFLLIPCNKGALARLDKLQAKCLRIILGCMKSSAINALQVECNDPPLALRRQYLAFRFIARIVGNNSHPLSLKLGQLNEVCQTNDYWRSKDLPLTVKALRIIQNLEGSIKSFDKLPLFQSQFNILTFEPEIFLDIGIPKKSSLANSLFNDRVQEYWSDYQRFFTDASKLSKFSYTGAAIYYQNSRIVIKFKCPKEASVFTGECVAILEACLYIQSHNINKAVIFTDSLSCLKALQQSPFVTRVHSHLILEIKKSIFSCRTNNKIIQLVWIPSHSGIRGNECADSLAKSVDSSQICDMKHFLHLGYDLQNLARDFLYSSWQHSWDSSSKKKGGLFHSIQPDIPRKPWFYLFKRTPRGAISSICRMRIGHCCSPVFLHKIRVRDSSLCECGIDEGSLEHIFFSCPNNQAPINLYKHVIKLKIPVPINFSSLLTHSSPHLFKILIHFICQNSIKL